MLRLKWSLQALACSSKEQISLYPNFVCPGDELVLEFDQHNTMVQKKCKLSVKAQSALNALGKFLEKHSGDSYKRMYLEPSGLNEPEWIDIRNLAKTALNAFDWEHELPPKDRGDIYKNKRINTNQVNPIDVSVKFKKQWICTLIY